MKNGTTTLNTLKVVGEVCETPQFSHTTKDERKMYHTVVKTKRLSEVYDFIPVTFSEEMLGEFKLGSRVRVNGSMRTFTYMDEELGRNRVKVLAYAYSALELDADSTENDMCEVEIIGTICKDVIVRQTPKGRCISDILVAVNTSRYRSDYIPVICWGKTAYESKEFAVGDKIKVVGRFQSREYNKEINGETEVRVAYELSARSIENLGVNNCRVDDDEYEDDYTEDNE